MVEPDFWRVCWGHILPDGKWAYVSKHAKRQQAYEQAAVAMKRGHESVRVVRVRIRKKSWKVEANRYWLALKTLIAPLKARSDSAALATVQYIEHVLSGGDP